MTLKRSGINDVFPPQIGNILAAFVDINDGVLKLKDQAGNVTTLSAYINIPTPSSGIIIEGSGAGSSIRCGVGNTTLAPCSTAVSGCANNIDASACMSTIGGENPPVK